MANSARLVGLLDHADNVFRLAFTLGESGREAPGSLPFYGDWEEEHFDSLCRLLLGLREPIENPPEGFAAVANCLLEVARLVKLIRDEIALGEQRGVDGYRGIAYQKHPGLDSAAQSGWQAVNDVRRLQDDPFAFVDKLPGSGAAFSLLDRFPATPAGHVAFLEFVRDDVHNAAQAKRHQLERRYSSQTLANMVRGIKWVEARERIASLPDAMATAAEQLARVVRRELTVSTVEQIEGLLTPAITTLRDALEQSGYSLVTASRSGNQPSEPERSTPKQEGKHETGVEPSPLVRCVLQIGDWEGNCSELLARLNELATEADKQVEAWPRTPRSLSTTLRRHVPDLTAAGVDVDFGRRGDKRRTRYIALRRTWGDSSLPIIGSNRNRAVRADPMDVSDADDPPSDANDQPSDADDPPSDANDQPSDADGSTRDREAWLRAFDNDPSAQEAMKRGDARRADREMNMDHSSMHGKVIDLDVAIRTSGDTPNRIGQWPRIRHFLRKRFDASASDSQLWERCTDWLQAEHGLMPDDFLAWPIDRLVEHLQTSAEPTASGKGTPNRRRARGMATVDRLRTYLTDRGIQYDRLVPRVLEGSEEAVQEFTDVFGPTAIARQWVKEDGTPTDKTEAENWSAAIKRSDVYTARIKPLFRKPPSPPVGWKRTDGDQEWVAIIGSDDNG
jgi:hypothetical protein